MPRKIDTVRKQKALNQKNFPGMLPGLVTRPLILDEKKQIRK